MDESLSYRGNQICPERTHACTYVRPLHAHRGRASRKHSACYPSIGLAETERSTVTHTLILCDANSELSAVILSVGSDRGQVRQVSGRQTACWNGSWTMSMSGALSSMMAVKFSGSRVNVGIVVAFDTFPAAATSVLEWVAVSGRENHLGV